MKDINKLIIFLKKINNYLKKTTTISYMEKSFLNELVTKRNQMYLKKINPKETIKATQDNDEYLTIDETNYNKSLNNIFNQNNILKERIEQINKNNKKMFEKIDLVNQTVNSNYLNISRNTKGLIYLGIFALLSQIVVTGINDYLMLSVFN